MNYVGSLARGVKKLYNEINPATLTGAIDVVVVQQEDGSFRCSPFHVRFGKLGVIRSKEKIVDLEINGQKVEDLHMILGDAGEAFFVEKVFIDFDGTENVTSCDLENISLPELSALIAAATNSSSLNINKPAATATVAAAAATLTVNNESLAKSVENLAADLKNQRSKTSILSSSISSTDLSSGKPPAVLKSRETTPQKSKPIPISGSSSNLSSYQSPTAVGTQSPMSSHIELTPSTQFPLIVSSASPVSPSSPNSNIHSDTSPMPALASNNTHNSSTSQLQPKVHNFYSDGELTPELTSPAVSRPPTPKSDTELEVTIKTKSRSNTTSDNQYYWGWGELPSRQNTNTKLNTLIDSIESSKQKPTTVAGSESSAKSPSKLLGMFSLMSVKATSETVKSDGGIYLDETEKLDSEVAAIYLDQKSNAKLLAAAAASNHGIKTLMVSNNNATSKDDDQESGNGQSLPQSPLRDYYSVIGDVQLSLCGFVFNNNNMLTNTNQENASLASNTQQLVPATNLDVDTSNFEDIFQQHAVSYDKFMEETNTITLNPNLIVKINNKYMTWANAAPIILSAVVFNKNLPNELANPLLETKAIKQAEAQLTVDPKKSAIVTAPTASNPAVASNNSGYFRNIFWSTKQQQTATVVPPEVSLPSTLTSISAIQSKTTTTTTTTTVTTTVQTNHLITPVNTISDTVAANNASSNEFANDTIFNVDLTPTQPSILATDGLIKCGGGDASSSSNENSVNNDPTTANLMDAQLGDYLEEEAEEIEEDEEDHREIKYRKTTRLSSELIMKLNLQPGSNEIQYSVTTALQGTTKITSNIFLWNYNDKVIVSDIDGTITKSDVWGQVLPMFGRDWSQAGVADLFTAIERNQYKFMYLSARAIGQASLTRDLLRRINQDGFTLPEGPLLVTPSSLFTAFSKEVIEKKPEEFKISCLKDIQSLFPYHNPYYAGYGNKTSDVKSYKTVGIPESRIFTINPQGEVKHEVSGAFQSSYSKLCDYVDLIFPPIKGSLETKSEYDCFNYWRDPTPASVMDEIEKEIKDSLSKEAKEKASTKKSSTSTAAAKAAAAKASASVKNSPKNGSINAIAEP